jgi:hypothetical protein
MSLRLPSPTGIPFRTWAANLDAIHYSGSDVWCVFSQSPQCVQGLPLFEETTTQVGYTKARSQISLHDSLGITVFVYLGFGGHRVNNEGVLPWITSGQSGVEVMHQVGPEMISSSKRRSRRAILMAVVVELSILRGIVLCIFFLFCSPSAGCSRIESRSLSRP